jgi:hypothetical protein
MINQLTIWIWNSVPRTEIPFANFKESLFCIFGFIDSKSLFENKFTLIEYHDGGKCHYTFLKKISSPKQKMERRNGEYQFCW